MRLRLPRWLRREPVPPGRHVRGVAPVTAPGAAAALVMGAAEPWLTPRPAPARARPTTESLHPVEPAAVTPGDQVPSTVTSSDIGTATEPLPAVAAASPLPEPTVALGFADGEELRLAPDDPRLAGFQDAAAAVLGQHQG